MVILQMLSAMDTKERHQATIMITTYHLEPHLELDSTGYLYKQRIRQKYNGIMVWVDKGDICLP